MAIWLRHKRAQLDKRPDLTLPHERDETATGEGVLPQPLMEQARRDVESGQQDTDLHGTRGLEKPEKWPEI